MTRKERALVHTIGRLLEEEIRPALPSIGDWRLTLVCRVPGKPDSDLLITGDDDLGEVAAAIERSQCRKEIT